MNPDETSKLYEELANLGKQYHIPVKAGVFGHMELAIVVMIQ